MLLDLKQNNADLCFFFLELVYEYDHGGVYDETPRSPTNNIHQGAVPVSQCLYPCISCTYRTHSHTIQYYSYTFTFCSPDTAAYALPVRLLHSARSAGTEPEPREYQTRRHDDYEMKRYTTGLPTSISSRAEAD